jgi:hypothetical protein
VAGGGPAMGRREREVSSALHGRKTVRGGSAPLTVGMLATAEVAGQRRSGRSDSDGRLQTRRRHGRDERCRDGRGEVASAARRRFSDSRSERRCRDAGARYRQRI